MSFGLSGTSTLSSAGFLPLSLHRSDRAQMDELGLFGILAFFTFVMVGTITFTVVSRAQYLRDGLRMVETDTE